MCNTGIDGTSIDSIEAVAVAAGLDAVQMVVPAEQILAVPEEYFPGIVVTVLPDGFAHFVVAWRRGRRRVALMDPASGRRSLPPRQFATELYRHDLEVPTEMWRAWASGPEFREGLLRRAIAVGVARDSAADLVALALQDEGPHGLAALDAALRSEERGSARFTRSAVLHARLREHVVSRGTSLERSSWSCVIPDDVSSGQVTLRGAVLLRAKSWNADAAEPQTRAELAIPEPNPYRTVIEAVKRVSWLPVALILIAFATAVANALQLLGFRSMLGPDGLHFGLMIAIILGLTVLRGVATVGSLALGRQLDVHVRGAWMRAPSKLPASFIRSRPVSDIVFRAHSTHRLREFPSRAMQILTAAFIATIAMAVVMLAAPQAMLAVSMLFLAAVSIPWLFSRALAQADLRAQTLSGCLARPVSDALLGAQALHQKGVASALLAEHDVLAAGWQSALQRLNFLTGLSRAIAGSVAVLALAWCLHDVAGESAGLTLLVMVLGILIIDAGSTCAQVLQTFPSVRSTLLRQSGPLNAVRIGRQCPTARLDAESAIVLEEVHVQNGSVDVLRDVSLKIPHGAHVAVVGATGSGKSTLLSVVLGTTETSAGTVSRADRRDTAGSSWAAPTAWLWGATVRSNVAFAGSRLSSSVESRLSLVGVDDPEAFARREVGEGGALLSDGEAQRVRLARALGRPDASVVVLDEALRGLPRKQRTATLGAIREVWSESVVLCALHEMSDAATFDLVVVMEGGRVVEFDDPRKLLADETSRFRRLARSSERRPHGWKRVDLASLSSVSARHGAPDSSVDS